MESRCPICNRAANPEHPEASHSASCPNREPRPSTESPRPPTSVAAKQSPFQLAETEDTRRHPLSRAIGDDAEKEARRLRLTIRALIWGSSLIVTCVVGVSLWFMWRTMVRIQEISDDLSKTPPITTNSNFPSPYSGPPIEVSQELKDMNIDFEDWFTLGDDGVNGFSTAKTRSREVSERFFGHELTVEFYDKDSARVPGGSIKLFTNENDEIRSVLIDSPDKLSNIGKIVIGVRQAKFPTRPKQ